MAFLRNAVPDSARTPMARNGFALMLSVMLTSGMGVLFWAVAARLYAPEQLGLGSALISSSMALGSIALLNLDNVINRFLPTSGASAKRLVASAYGTSALIAIVTGAIFVATAERFVPALGSILTAPSSGLWFTVSVVFWSIFSLQEIVLTAMQRSAWVPVENAFYAVAKVILLPLLASVAVTGLMLFVTWTLLVPILVVAVNAFVFRQLARPDGHAATRAATPRFFSLVRLMGWDYVGRAATTAAIGLIPLIIVAVAGGAESAKYALAWTIAYSTFLLGNAMGRSMLAVAAAEPENLLRLAGEAFVWAMIPVIAIVVVLVPTAHWIMALFGPVYTGSAATVLQILLVDSILGSALAIYLAVARVRDRFAVVALVEGSNLVMVVLLSLALLPSLGIAAVALAWLVSHAVIWASILSVSMTPGRRHSSAAFVRSLRLALLKLRTTVIR